MTETVKFVDGINYTESDQADFNMNMRPQGVLGESALGVLTWSAIGGLFIRVTPGAALIRGFLYKNDANKDIAVGANSSGSTRIDTLVVRVNPTANTAVAQLIVGTPGAGAPALTQVVGGTWDFPLADITVANGASTILAGNVTSRALLSTWPVNTLDPLVALDADVTAEAAARATAEAALSSRISVFEALHIRAAGRINGGSGSLIWGWNVSASSRAATGTYFVDISPAAPNTNCGVLISPELDGARPSAEFISTSQIFFTICTPYAVGTTTVDATFSFLAFGG